MNENNWHRPGHYLGWAVFAAVILAVTFFALSAFVWQPFGVGYPGYRGFFPFGWFFGFFWIFAIFWGIRWFFWRPWSWGYGRGPLAS